MPATLYNKEGRIGTAIVSHGLGGWKDQAIILSIVEAFISTGFTVLTYDAADGANGPDTNPRKSTTTGHLEDLEDVVAYAKTQEWFCEPLILAGHSLGAMISAEYAKRHADVSRIILVAPAISWKTYRKFVFPMALWWLVAGSFKMLGPTAQGYRLGRPWLLDFVTWNGYASARTVSIPALVITAENDGLVGTIETHTRYARSFPNATHVVVKGADHDFDSSLPAVTDTITAWHTSL